jgi:hypothetical protein
MGSRLVAHDPSVRDYADIAPAKLGRRIRKVGAYEWDAPSKQVRLERLGAPAYRRKGISI